MHTLYVWERAEQRMLREKVPNLTAMRMIHGTAVGRRLARALLARPLASKLYGARQRTPASRHRIEAFVERHGIDVSEHPPLKVYRCFDDFFQRPFLPGARPFVQEPEVMPAPAEGRVSAFDVAEASTPLPVKRHHVSPAQLLGDDVWAKRFAGGPALVLRLAPQDYHRFHYVDDGEVLAHMRRKGWLYSVHPIAIDAMGAPVHPINARHITVYQTRAFGVVASIEVGAMTVGRIIQNHAPPQHVRRGDEKGRFAYGGSTVIILGEPGAWTPDPEITRRTTEGIETRVRLGTPVAYAPSIAEVCS